MREIIEVRILETGDTAEAETPDHAVFAALTIAREAKQHAATQGFDPTIIFAVGGKIVRSTTLRSLTR